MTAQHLGLKVGEVVEWKKPPIKTLSQNSKIELHSKRRRVDRAWELFLAFAEKQDFL